jgi:hypothetical protein
MEPWRQTLADNPDIAALMYEDVVTLNLRLTAEEFADWFAFAKVGGETVEEAVHRVMKRAAEERRDYEQSRREFGP